MATIFVHAKPGTEVPEIEHFELPAHIRVVGEPLQATHARLIELTESEYTILMDNERDLIHIEVPGPAIAFVFMMISQRIGGKESRTSTCDVKSREVHDAG